MSDLIEIDALPTKSPQVDALIHRVMSNYPGISASAQSAYYEVVHQHLAPLARQLEEQRDALLLLCKEGADGFGRVLIATSDDKAVRDWQKHCRIAITKIEAVK